MDHLQVGLGLDSDRSKVTIEISKDFFMLKKDPSLTSMDASNISTYVISNAIYTLWNHLILVHGRVIGIMEGLVLKWSIEPSSVIWSHGELFLQSVHEIRVAGKVPTIQQSIIFTRFHYSPGVLIVPSTSREERGGTKDLAETIKGHIQQTPALKELILLFGAEDLFITLGRLAVCY